MRWRIADEASRSACTNKHTHTCGPAPKCACACAHSCVDCFIMMMLNYYNPASAHKEIQIHTYIYIHTNKHGYICTRKWWQLQLSSTMRAQLSARMSRMQRRSSAAFRLQLANISEGCHNSSWRLQRCSMDGDNMEKQTNIKYNLMITIDYGTHTHTHTYLYKCATKWKKK